MITTRQQLEDWIKENQLVRWKFFLTNPNSLKDGERTNDCIADSSVYPGEIDEKIEMTARQLERSGQRAYGVGFHSDKGTNGGMCEVAQLQQGTIYSQQQVSGVSAPVDEAAMAARIRKEILTEMKEATYEQRLKELDQREREFAKEKAGAIGLLIEYTKPILAAVAAAKGGHAAIAGIDQPGVVAEPITVQPAEEAAPAEEEESVFTDEEADELLELMARFKKAEPDYLVMIRKVVQMAETGDTMYGMAKSFLTK